MRNPTLARTFGAIVVVAALALGIAVFVQSARGQDDGPPVASVPYPTADPNATPTRTAQETSDFSEAAQATAQLNRKQAADNLVASGVSVAKLKRVETTGDVGAPLAFDDAMNQADSVVVGEVQDQVLAWQVDPTTGERSLMLASIVKTDDAASPMRVLEPIQLAYVPRDGSPGEYDQVLAYYGIEPLETGERYAVLARLAPNDAGYDLIFGHAYAVGSDGRLSPVFDREETAPAKGLTQQSLTALFAERRAQ